MLAAFFLLAQALLISSVAAVWPLPSNSSYGTSVLFIDPSVRVTYSASGGYGSNPSRPAIVSTAIDCTLDTIFTKTYYPWMFHPRNTNFDPATGSKISVINLVQRSATPSNSTDVDESYSLSVSATGTVTITANSPTGISYGLTTFSQLFYKTGSGRVYTSLAPVQISDAPKFKHRGLNMDIARSYYPPAAVLKMIDGLAYNKMNRLHLHITDSQSWPLEVPALPLLAEKGRYAPGLTYSPDVLRQIQQYGANRGVQVYLEIDMPGHAGIVELAYPGLTVAWNIQPDWGTWALEPPSGALKINSTQVDDFLSKLFNDVVPRTKPFTPLWHAGGDEVVTHQYLLEPGIQSSNQAVIKPFMQRFVDRNLKQIQFLGATPIVWQEMLLEWNLTLSSDVIVQIWKSSSDVLATVKSGHRAIVGDYNQWYLDCGYGQWIDFAPASAPQYYPFNDYCSPRKNWRQIYAFDPLDSVPSDLAHLVLGGEVHSWSEQTDAINVDGKVWPRAAAAAEVLWSGAKDAQGQNRSQIEASPRLADMRERLVAKGIQAEPVHMPFCTQNGTQCAL
ncbi:glycoside hydrolase family 20 protein [Myriangium duriaei CBS 260.36]|uniref:Beta-hexosaminidase n=1 Tax=Myriangium duriaei CBS 260.36 TaxID=1168546 RepID=A0A9P4J937_9PEZI|nr:glycoside hydrolase family 20 protein [Myriangium duriaei CBS 260.36]